MPHQFQLDWYVSSRAAGRGDEKNVHLHYYELTQIFIPALPFITIVPQRSKKQVQILSSEFLNIFSARPLPCVPSVTKQRTITNS